MTARPAPELAARVGRALDGVADPCLAAAGIDGSIVDLGLVQAVRADEAGAVEVEVALTEVGCAFTHHLLDAVWRTVQSVDGVRAVEVRPVWTWTPEQMTGELAGRLRHRSEALPALLGDRGRRHLPVLTS